MRLSQGLVRSCHDCSEGGLGVAAAEMAFAGGLGMRLSLMNVPSDADVTADDVSLSRSLTVDSLPRLCRRSRSRLRSVGRCSDCCIGTVVESADFGINSTDGSAVVETTIGRLIGELAGDVSVVTRMKRESNLFIG